MSNKNENVCTTLDYIEHFLTLVFAVTVCISISTFSSLVYISTGIMSSAIGSNFCAIIARIIKHKSIIKKRKHDEIALLSKTNLHCIKASIFRSLTDSYIVRDDFLLIDVLREYHNTKEKINILETS